MFGSGTTSDDLLVILAHESAQPTIDLFLPKWEALDCDLICAVPVGHKVSGFDHVVEHGESAHAGRKVFERFIAACKMSMEGEHKRIVIAEYDTVPLRPQMLPVVEDKITCGLFISTPHNCEVGDLQALALSPWAMTRETMDRFIHEMDSAFEIDPDGVSFDGLLDRWLGWILMRGGFDIHTTHKLSSYPIHPGSRERIKRTGAIWVHGWKTREQFGDLWI